MSNIVSAEVVPARLLAAVRRQVRIGEVGAAWRPALDQVWAFLRHNSGLRTDGHNVFLYHHPASREMPMNVDFGVQVTRSFERSGEVCPTATPAGEVAAAVHVGPYDQMRETHDAIHAWAADNNMTFAGKSWEIYGDWTDDPANLETRVEYLLL
jgi:effector-binding domain-containing protein